MGYFTEMTINVADPVWVYKDKFKRELFLPKLMLKIPKNEGVLKFYSEDAKEVVQIEKYNLWQFIHPSLNVNDVNRVRVTKDYYFVLYYFKMDFNFENVFKYVATYMDEKEAMNYSVEYSYE